MKGDVALVKNKEKVIKKECDCTKDKCTCNSCGIEEDNAAQEAMDKLTEELNEQKNKFLRLAAEYENYRKRTEKDRLTIYRDATASTVAGILPIADSIEIAIKSCENMNDDCQKGLILIQNQLNAALEKLNITSFGEVNEEFNPDLHNAIAHIDSEEFKENVIVQVFQKGYKMDDKIIRHAMVKVAN